MEFKECKSCGNTAKGFEILRCKKCMRVIGCYDNGFISKSGCAVYLSKQDKCPNCGNETWFGFPWWERAGEIK